jgi:membrane-associated protease RseP (regulator of RpoE activity)
MVSTLTLVLAGVLLYTVVAMALKQRRILPEYFKVSGPLLTIHSQRGKALLNRLAQRRRFWRAWANVGVGIALLLLVALFAVVLLSAYQNITSPNLSPIQNPQDVLVIPGVNQFLPLSAAPDIIIGLLVGLVVHEGGHGLLCRVEDIGISSMGVVLFSLIPIGAFVEPDEEERAVANRGAQTRMFAAGVTNNFAVTVVAFALLFGPVTGAISVAAGVPVGGSLPGSPAENAGIGHGDRITAVNGTNVTDLQSLQNASDATNGGTVRVTLQDDTEVTVDRAAFVTRAVPNGPFDVETGDRIASINGTPVDTERGFEDAMHQRRVATVTTENGTTSTGPVGAYLIVARDGPLLDGTDLSTGDAVVVTAMDDRRIVDADALRGALADTDPGTSVELQLYRDGGFENHTVELGENPDTGGALIGAASIATGTTGLAVNDLGVRPYPADLYLELVSGDGLLGGLGDGSLGRILLVLLMLPFAAAVSPGLGYNFAGFLDPITNFYAVSGPLAAAGDGMVFFLANVLFWTGWVNFNLGLFNCIPAFPLDGGHILRTSTEAILSRTPLDHRRHVTAVTTSIGLIMLFSLLAMVFAPRLLG